MRRRHELSLSGQDSLPVGTTFDFDYTGTVQSIDLPEGRYKLQCWGAQGGSVTGDYNAVGSKGGYSEGILSLLETTTLYIFVGGEGTSCPAYKNITATDKSILNGGWNCGGGSIKAYCYGYDTARESHSHPRPGGGATDICLTPSDMEYVSGRNSRSNESRLSRFIVAGGGAGANAMCSKMYVDDEVSINYYVSDGTQQGGGTSGKGKFPGAQAPSINASSFGFGSSQLNNGSGSFRYYLSAAGGAGWYGGSGNSSSTSPSDSMKFSGGGSGFVNIPSNSEYRPSDYTGLELESGETIAGDTSFPSPSGGSEIGHSGNGFAKITVL